MFATVAMCNIMPSTPSFPSPQFLVKENMRVRKKAPELLVPLMELHYEKVDKVISPGLIVIRWTSMNLDAYINDVTSSLAELDLLTDRLIGMHNNRILLLLKEIETIQLFHIPESGTIDASEFHSSIKELCSTTSGFLDVKSQVIEKVVLEMIEMLIGPEVMLEEAEDISQPGALSTTRKMEQRTKLLQEGENLQFIYEQMLIDSQNRLIRHSLEMIRKRLATNMLTYSETKDSRMANPLFESDLILAVPDIIMKPSLDEIQQSLNRAVSSIISVTKGVYRWGQIRNQVPSPPSTTRPLHSRSDIRSRSHVTAFTSDKSSLKTFYQAVSEHKEVQKLVAILSSAINSTKNIVKSAIEKFDKYSHLWTAEREEKMKKFMEEVNPGVNEFRSEMSDYAQLSDIILMEPEVLPAGAISLSAEKLKLSLNAETRAWIVSYGRNMNYKYQTVMEDVFKSIDDWTKRLSHPINDLDDIRSIMATLKEVRENEIHIDMSLDPIEVSVRWESGE